MPDRSDPLSPDGEDGRGGIGRPRLAPDDAPTPPRGQRLEQRDATPPRTGRSQRGRRSDDDITPARGIPRQPTADWPDDDEELDGDGLAEPNYMVRRIAAGAILVVVLAIVWFVGRALIGGDDEGSTDSPSDWDKIAVLSGAEVTVLDRDGSDEIATYPLGADALDLQTEVIGNTLVTLAEDGKVVRRNLDDGTAETDRAAADYTLLVAPDNPRFALVVSDVGGDVTVVDTARGQVISIAEVTEIADPLIFGSDVRINASGSHLAVAIPRLFQSFLIDLETSESTALAGRVMAIDDDRVVTEQPVGDQAEINFYALDGDRLGSRDVAAPMASMITPGGSMLLVTAEGKVISSDPDGTDEVGELADPDGRRIVITGGSRAFDGERLVASAENAVFVIDADGEQLATFAGRVAVPPTVRSKCVALATGTSTIGVAVVDLETGTAVADVESGFVTSTSTDGCTVATSGASSPQIIRDGDVDDVEADAIVAVAPDGTAYVAIDGRRTSLYTAEDSPVEITNRPALVRFG